jgi:hypothetical protein
MTATHTPGPWRVDAGDDGDIYIETFSGELVGIAPLDTKPNAPNRATQHANARLIAAAPEMHDELHMADSLVNDVLDALRDEDAIMFSAIRRRLRERSTAIRALLARIDGGTE